MRVTGVPSEPVGARLTGIPAEENRAVGRDSHAKAKPDVRTQASVGMAPSRIRVLAPPLSEGFPFSVPNRGSSPDPGAAESRATGSRSSSAAIALW